MNKQYFVELMDYLLWADQQVMGWIAQISEQQWLQERCSSFNSIKNTAVHIVSAEKIWLDFWAGTEEPVYLSTEFTGGKQELIDIWKETSNKLQDFINKYPEQNYLNDILVRKPGGAYVEMAFRMTFPHMINHASYHRGQLVTLLRQAGFTTFSNTDLFTYYDLDHKISDNAF